MKRKQKWWLRCRREREFLEGNKQQGLGEPRQVSRLCGLSESLAPSPVCWLSLPQGSATPHPPSCFQLPPALAGPGPTAGPSPEPQIPTLSITLPHTSPPAPLALTLPSASSRLPHLGVGHAGSGWGFARAVRAVPSPALLHPGPRHLSQCVSLSPTVTWCYLTPGLIS